MGIVSILKNWSNKLSGNHKEKRTLRFESLEQRHLLSVSPLELPYYIEETTAYVAPQLETTYQEVVFSPAAAPQDVPQASVINPVAYTVTSLSDINSTIQSAHAAGYTGITIQLTGGGNTMSFPTGTTTIDGSIMTDGVTLDLNGKTLSVGNYRTASITGVTFTSEASYSNYNANHQVTVFNNTGTLTLTDCQFEGIEATRTTNSESTLTGDLRILSNSGTLTLDRVFINDNSISVTNARNYGNPYANATIHAIYNTSSNCTLSNVMIYGNDATATTFNGNRETETIRALNSTSAVTVYNCTILQPVYVSNSCSVYNTIYGENASDRNYGWTNTNNNRSITTAAGLAAIFEYYASETGTFVNNGVKDYSLKADASVIDAGNNTHINGATKDIAGNARVYNDTVDIGAVEYAPLVVKTQCDVPTNVEAAPAAGLAGLDTLVLVWDLMDDADGYELRYYIGDSVDGLADEDWTPVSAGFLEGDTTMSYTLTGLVQDQHQTVYFEVRSITEDDSLEASAWASASAMTKTQLATLVLDARATATDTILITWPTAGFTGDVMLEYWDAGLETWVPQTLVYDTDYTVTDDVATVVADGLDEYTAYRFRATAITGDDSTVLSAEVSAEVSETTFFQLRDPAFTGTPEIGTETIIVSLANDLENADYVAEFVVQCSTESDFSVLVENVVVDTATLTVTASGLEQGVAYYFRAMATNDADGYMIDSQWVGMDQAITTFFDLADYELAGLLAIGVNNENTIEVTWGALPEGVSAEVKYSPNDNRWTDGEDWLADNTWYDIGVEMKEDGTGALITDLFKFSSFHIGIFATAGDGSAYLGTLDVLTEASTLLQLVAPWFRFDTGTRTAESVTLVLDDSYNARFGDVVDHYLVQYTTNIDGWHNSVWSESLVLDPVTGTVSGLEHDTAYYFRVMAVGADGVSLSSGWMYDTQNTASTLIKLEAPENLAVTRPDDAMESTYKQNISWDAVNGATGYVLQYVRRAEPFTAADVLDAEWVEVGETDLLDVSLSPLVPGNYYLYRVKAVGDPATHEESVWTTQETALRTRMELVAPDDWFAYSANQEEMEFYINADLNVVDEITVRYRPVDKDTHDPLDDGQWTEIAYSELELKVNRNTGTVYYVFRGLALGTCFEFQAKVSSSNDDYIDSDWSKSTFESLKDQHISPTGLVVSQREIDGFMVSWDGVETATGYKVEYAPGEVGSIGDSEWISIGIVNGTEYVFTGLAEDTHYVVRVTATGNTRDYYDSVPSDVAANTLKQLVLAEGAVEAVPYFGEDYALEFNTDKMIVTWTAVENASGYEVTCFDTLGGQIEQRTFDADTLAYVFENLAENTEYSFTVKALGDGEFYGDSEAQEVSGTTARTLDEAVITLVKRTSTMLAITWSPVEGAAGYRIACAAGNDLPVYIDIAADGALAYTFGAESPLAHSTDYTITVITTGVEANATASSVATATDYTLIKLSDDVKLAPESGATSSNTITLIFDDPNAYAHVSGYTLKCSQEYDFEEDNAIVIENAQMTRVPYGDGSRVTVTITGLNPGANYIFELNIHGVTDVSEDTGFIRTFDDAIRTWALLDAPADLAVETGETTHYSVTLTWTEVAGANGYKVQYREAGEVGESEPGEWISATAAMVGDGTATITGLTHYTDYDFRVMAVGLHGASDDSAYCEPVSEMTLPCPLSQVQGVTAVADGGTRITITWTELENVTEGDISYEVTVMQGETLVGTYSVVGGTYTLTEGLWPKTEYTVTVVAVPTDEKFSDSDSSAPPASVTTLAIPVDAPELTAVFLDEQIVFGWSEVELDGDWEGSVHYELMYTTAGNSEPVLLKTFTAGTNDFTWDDFQYDETYTFWLVAFGPEATHGSAASETVNVVTPVEITMEGVIRKQASSFTDTDMPTTEVWVDEWTTVYFEVWTSVTEGVVAGRKLTFTVGVDSSLYAVSAPAMPEGIQLFEEDGVWTMIVTDAYTPADGDAAMLVQFTLTPVPMGGLLWGDMYTETAFELNDDAIGTTVFAVPYDTNDNGVVDSMDYDGFAMFYDSYHPFADINGDGRVTNEKDWQWVLKESGNLGVTYLNPENLVYYAGFPYEFIKAWEGELPTPFVGIAAEPMSTPMIAAFEATTSESYVATTFAQTGATTYLGMLPVINDANAMSTSTLPKNDSDGFADLATEADVLAMRFDEENLEDNPEDMM